MEKQSRKEKKGLVRVFSDILPSYFLLKTAAAPSPASTARIGAGVSGSVGCSGLSGVVGVSGITGVSGVSGTSGVSAFQTA